MAAEQNAASRRVVELAAEMDRRLTDLIGTEDYPNPLTSLHTELRLALWAYEREKADDA